MRRAEFSSIAEKTWYQGKLKSNKRMQMTGFHRVRQHQMQERRKSTVGATDLSYTVHINEHDRFINLSLHWFTDCAL